jgi:hypothetical protein
MLGMMIAGCGAMTGGGKWGEDATVAPGWGRLGQAALNAVAAPETWATAAAGLAFRIADRTDRSVTEWAARNAPVYGSQQRASRVSDNIVNAADLVWAASVLATPSGEKPGEWAVNKAKGLAVQAGGGVLMRGTVGFFKDAIDKKAPNRTDEDGFPSGHITQVAYFSTLTSRNIGTLEWPRRGVTAARISLGILTAAEGWARIEANQHFPSEMFGSIALGHFLGAFFNDAFMGIRNKQDAALLIEPRPKGVTALVRFFF